MEGGELLVTAAGQPHIELPAKSEISLLVAGRDVEIEFVRDHGGQVSGLIFRQGDHDLLGAKVK